MTENYPPRSGDSMDPQAPAAGPAAHPAADNDDTIRLQPSEAPSPHESTHRFEDFFGAAPPAPPTAPPPGSASGSGSGKARVAGLVAACLVVGGLSGLAGAAGYSALDAEPATASRGANADTSDADNTDGADTDNTSVADTPDIPAADGSVEQVAQSVLPSVVKINVAGQQGAGSGSGVILSEDGEILTNNHVVEVADGVGRISVSFSDGSSAPAEIVGTDPLTDLAVVQAEDVSGLTPVAIGESSQLDVGENVVAIGAPFGLQATVTSGIVSALNRPVSVGESAGTDTTYPAIQTDAAINPGNSGGPLVNMRGELVGINSSIRTASSGLMGGEGGSIGLGFAIPIDNVLPIVEELRGGETPTHARLGVTVADAASNDGLLTGAGIQTVTDGSAADEAGLAEGDVVTRVDDQIISDSQSLVATIRGYRPGDEVTVTYVRGDGDDTGDAETETVTVTLDSDGGQPNS